MSFILDALKKSEAERQHQAGGEFSNVPTGSADNHSFKWLWILALLLLVNFAVLLGVLMRDDTPGALPEPADAVESLPESASASQPSFEQRLAVARENQPAPVTQAQPAAPPAISARPEPAPVARNVPTFDELRVNGTLQMTDLHLDIHVFAENPADRFVFINMNKQRENTQLEEGPVVREITADGVILEHQGATFLLPRE